MQEVIDTGLEVRMLFRPLAEDGWAVMRSRHAAEHSVGGQSTSSPSQLDVFTMVTLRVMSLS